VRINEIEALGGGTTFKELSKTNLENFEIDLPPLPTQSAIARVLSSLDDKIELNNKINKKLENMAKTIYEYWFVQNADKRWERKKLNGLGVDVIRGVTYNKNDIKTANDKDVIGILRATNINGNIIDLDNLVYVDKSLISENQKLQPFDILITMSSGSKEHIGKNGLFCFDNANVAFGAFCSKIDVEEKIKFYLYIYFQSEQFKGYVKNCCLGTNINNLNNEIIKDISITIPPSPILQKFNKTVSPIFSAIIKNRQENNYLAQLRDFLLPLLMNGQVKVGRN
jgi:type I restriction enzyme S subunit